MSDGIQALESSQSQHIFENMLSTYYTPMEVWYARTVIDKVGQLPLSSMTQSEILSSPAGTSLVHIRPLTTSCVHNYPRRRLLHPEDCLVSFANDRFSGDCRTNIGAFERRHGQGLRSCHQAQA